jgi:hypothetical protein
MEFLDFHTGEHKNYYSFSLRGKQLMKRYIRVIIQSEKNERGDLYRCLLLALDTK